ncbi:hypothetical protein BJX99DRAFT_263548 [Aspergillus californicus]
MTYFDIVVLPMFFAGYPLDFLDFRFLGTCWSLLVHVIWALEKTFFDNPSCVQKYTHAGLVVFSVGLCYYRLPRTDGTELERLGRILTSHGYHRLASLNRRFDFWITPRADKDMMLEFFELWQEMDLVVERVVLVRERNRMASSPLLKAELRTSTEILCWVDKIQKQVRNIHERLADCQIGTEILCRLDEIQKQVRNTVEREADLQTSTELLCQVDKIRDQGHERVAELQAVSELLKEVWDMLHEWEATLQTSSEPLKKIRNMLHKREAKLQTNTELRCRSDKILIQATNMLDEITNRGICHRAWVQPLLEDMIEGSERLRAYPDPKRAYQYTQTGVTQVRG